MTVGIGNREHERERYRLIGEVDERTFLNRSVTVASGATWCEPVSFRVRSPGEHQVWFRLCLVEPGEDTFYREAYLDVRVRA